MATRPSFIVGEWYHCYNRGVDKRIVFDDQNDYERFLSLLFICNGTMPVRIVDIEQSDLISILIDSSIERGDPLVEIGAYALMPNHIHFILKEIREGGISLFMQKVFTGYTMYYNRKNERTGSLFGGTYKSKHIFDDAYLQLAVPYVLLNPVELFERKWKTGFGNIAELKPKLLNYRYASLPDFLGSERLENKLVGSSLKEYFDPIPTLQKMLNNAKEYYGQNVSFLD